MVKNTRGIAYYPTFSTLVLLMRWRRWHADVKPANILFINGKFKLADPGFVKFVQNNIEDPTAVLEGCTWTYSMDRAPLAEMTEISL